MAARRFLAVVLVFALLAFGVPAGASLYQGPDLLQGAGNPEGAYALSLSLGLFAWPDLSAQTLEALAGWLSGLRLKVLLKPGEGLAQLLEGDEVLLHLHTQEEGELATMTLEAPGTLVATRYTATPAQPPWQLLLGSAQPLPDPASARQALLDIAAAAMPHLLAYEKAVKSSLSIKNAGKGASQLVYSLNLEQARGFWQAASPALLPALHSLILALAPQQAASLNPALSALEVKGPLTVKRILDKEGGDLGLQITGAAALSGQTRRLTLFYGQSESGLYLSLKLPATRGGDTLEARLSLLYQADSVQGDWRLKTVSGKERLDAEGSLSLLREGARLSGSLDATLKVSGAEDFRAQYRVEPDLLLADGQASGTLRFVELSGKTPRREIRLTLEGTAADALASPAALAEIVLLPADAQQIALETARLQAAAAGIWNRFLQTLPLPQRLLALHDLGRDRRTQGESVPVFNPDGHSFTVEDGPGPSANEEETP